MIVFNESGIYCPVADLYIDPTKPVRNAVITHAHSDHARPGMGRYLTHNNSVNVLKNRLGSDIFIEGIGYGEPVFINGVRFSLHPSGHIWGSAQVRIEYKGEIWVVSGDYKLTNDNIAEPFEPIKCHNFITESTFGLPVFRFPEPDVVFEQINRWWRDNQSEGYNTMLFAYALGKAQRLLSGLDSSIGKVYAHSAVHMMNENYRGTGGRLPEIQVLDDSVDFCKIKGAMIIAPPMAESAAVIRQLYPLRIGTCSGWMLLNNARKRRGVDRGFVLSDHADWNELNRAVLNTGAENIYVTHGYKTAFARWLSEKYKLNAQNIEALYSE